jgi:hypothetical protein
MASLLRRLCRSILLCQVGPPRLIPPPSLGLTQFQAPVGSLFVAVLLTGHLKPGLDGLQFARLVRAVTGCVRPGPAGEEFG